MKGINGYARLAVGPSCDGNHLPHFQFGVRHRHWIPGVNCLQLEGETFQRGLNHIMEYLPGHGFVNIWIFYWPWPRVVWRWEKSNGDKK